MKKYQNPSFKLSSGKPVKIMPIIILTVFIVFSIFHLGKDCANYDKRHTTSLIKNR
jgi:hypothetical protein